MELLGQEVVLALLWVKCAEEPKLVFLDRPAHINAGIYLRKPIRRRALERELVGFTHEALRAEISEGITVNFVATALGDDVEDTAG